MAAGQTIFLCDVLLRSPPPTIYVERFSKLSQAPLHGLNDAVLMRRPLSAQQAKTHVTKSCHRFALHAEGPFRFALEEAVHPE